MPDLSSDIEDAATTPAAVTGDAGSVTARTVDELIKADQYLAAKNAAPNKSRGIRFSRLTPPGALDDNGGTSSPEDVT